MRVHSSGTLIRARDHHQITSRKALGAVKPALNPTHRRQTCPVRKKAVARAAAERVTDMPAHVEFGGVMGGGAPTYTGIRSAQTLTTTTSAQTAPAQGGDYAAITAIGGAVYFTVGQNPTALASGVNMRYCPAGATRDVGPLSAGDRIAAIDA